MFKYVLVASLAERNACVIFGNNSNELEKKLTEEIESDFGTFEAMREYQAEYDINNLYDFIKIYDLRYGTQVDFKVKMKPALKLL